MLSLASPGPVAMSNSDSMLHRKGQKAKNVSFFFAGCQEDKLLRGRGREKRGREKHLREEQKRKEKEISKL